MLKITFVFGPAAVIPMWRKEGKNRPNKPRDTGADNSASLQQVPWAPGQPIAAV